MYLVSALVIAVLLMVGYSMFYNQVLEGFGFGLQPDLAIEKLNYDDGDAWAPAVNFKDRQDNATTIGNFPAIPLCDQCKLIAGLGQGRDQYAVKTQCSNNHDINYSDLSKPIYVAARSPGRPRQCRQIVNYIN